MNTPTPGAPHASDENAALFTTIRTGALDRLRALLAAHPGLAATRLGSIDKTPLHVVTDWPGFFPNGPEVAQILIASGAVIDDRGPDGTGETPLHWAASSDDADVAAVLIDHGADINMPDGSIGTPIANAVGYACWNVAHLLAIRGARIEQLWVAAALGLRKHMTALIADGVTQAEVDQALWHACAGGQRRAAQSLHELGGRLDFTPDYARGSLLDSATGHGTQRTNLIEWLQALGVRPTSPD